MHTVIETPTYISGLKRAGVSADERQGIISMLAADPMSGNLIVGTGGARKVRYAKGSAGKSGGYRRPPSIAAWEPRMTSDAAGRFAYDGLDRVIHEKARLGVLTSLVSHPKGLAFSDLKALCGLTDGNLSRHLAVLEEADLVEIIKGYEAKRPHTLCRLTPIGRRRFLDYLDVLEGIVRDAAALRDGPAAARLKLGTT